MTSFQCISPLTQDIKDAITKRASSAISYEIETEIIREIMLSTFHNKPEMMTHASAIKYQIELALPAKDKETLDLSSQSLHNHEVSPEKKALMKARTNVLCKITRQYHRLVNECFPSFLDKINWSAKEWNCLKDYQSRDWI